MGLLKLFWWAVAWPFLLPVWIWRKWRKTVRTVEVITGRRTVRLGWTGFYTVRRRQLARRRRLRTTQARRGPIPEWHPTNYPEGARNRRRERAERSS